MLPQKHYGRTAKEARIHFAVWAGHEGNHPLKDGSPNNRRAQKKAEEIRISVRKQSGLFPNCPCPQPKRIAREQQKSAGLPAFYAQPLSGLECAAQR